MPVSPSHPFVLLCLLITSVSLLSLSLRLSRYLALPRQLNHTLERSFALFFEACHFLIVAHCLYACTILLAEAVSCNSTAACGLSFGELNNAVVLACVSLIAAHAVVIWAIDRLDALVDPYHRIFDEHGRAVMVVEAVFSDYRSHSQHADGWSSTKPPIYILEPAPLPPWPSTQFPRLQSKLPKTPHGRQTATGITPRAPNKPQRDSSRHSSPPYSPHSTSSPSLLRCERL